MKGRYSPEMYEVIKRSIDKARMMGVKIRN
jgi:hypothetical protein